MYDLIQKAKKKYDLQGESYLIDKHRLSYGLYVKIKKDGTISDENILSVNSKNLEDFAGKDELYHWFQERDFYSNPVSNNKGIDSQEKKINSTVPYAIFVKRENLIDQVKNLGTNNLSTLEKKPSTKEEIYQYVIYFFYEAMRKVMEIEFNYDFYKDYFTNEAFHLVEIADRNKLKGGDVIKFFFDEDVNSYKMFQDIYLSKTVFLSKDFGLEIDGELMNSWSFQTTLNVSKPHLVHSTTAFHVPFRTTLEEAIFAYKVSLVLKAIAKEFHYHMEINFKEKKVLSIIKEDQRVKKILYRNFKILQIENHQDILLQGEETPSSRKEVETETAKFMSFLLYDLYKIKDGEDVRKFKEKFIKVYPNYYLLNEMIMSRHTLKSYFVDKLDLDISGEIESIFKLILEEEIEALKNFRYLNEVRKRWDQQISLLNHFSGGRYMELPTHYVDMKNHILQQFATDGEFIIKDDKMFYFLAGQILFYLVSQNEGSEENQTGRWLSPFWNLSEPKEILKEVSYYTELYGHKLSLHGKNRVIRAIQGLYIYVEQVKEINESWIHLQKGLIGHNLFYVSIDNKKKDDATIKEEITDEENK